MDDIDRALTDLSETQHALVARHQAEEMGLSRSEWLYRRHRGDWHALSSCVLRRAGAPPSDAQRALAGILDVGPASLAGYQTGGALWGVPGFRIRRVQVMTLRDRHGRTELADVHHPLYLPDPFGTVLDGVPVVRPALLILQLAPLVHPDRLGRIFDNLWSRRLLSGSSVARELDPVLGRGRPGTTAVRQVLAERGDGYVPPASNLEARFLRILRDHDLPAMRRQVDLGDEDRWCGRVDFVGVDLGLVIEVDSDRYHRALSDVAADTDRRERLEAAGFRVLQVKEFDIWHRPAAVAAEVRAAIRELRRSRAA